MDSHTLRRTIIVAGVMASIAAMKWYIGSRKPVFNAAGMGIIAPNKPTIALCGVLSAAIGIFAIYAASTKHGGTIALMLGLGLLVLGMASLTSFSSKFNVAWDDEGVFGPTNFLFPPFGPTTGFIKWEDIESFETDFGNGWCIKDKRGMKIRWNFVYSGYAALKEDICKRRPDLFPK